MALTAVDDTAQCVFTSFVRQNGGTDEYVVKGLMSWLDMLGHVTTALRSDAEASMQDLLRTVASRRTRATIVQSAPKASHSSVGLVEATHYAVEGQLRTMRVALLSHDKGYDFKPSARLVAWMVRHCGWILTRVQLKADGSTARQRRTGKAYKREVAEFGGQVLFHLPTEEAGRLRPKSMPRWDLGVWVGKTDLADDHILLTVDGTRKSRSIKRVPEENKWRPEFLALVRGRPWNAAEDPEKEYSHQGPVYTFKHRRMYITRAMIGEHHSTPGCRACEGLAPAHSQACRTRFERIYGFAVPEEKDEEAGAAGGTDEAKAGADTVGAVPADEREAAQTGDVAAATGSPARQEPGSASGAVSVPKRPANASDGEGPAVKRQTTEIRIGGAEDNKMIQAVYALTGESEADLTNGRQETLTTCDAWWTGRLEEAMVAAARKEEMDRLMHFEVYEQIPIGEAKGEIVDTRWVDVPKNGAVRSRIVARQFANEAMAELFAGTPDATAFRMILHFVASDKERALLISDATSAFYQADVTMDQVVKPPKDVMQPGFYWKLKKAMPGLRMASRYWQDHQATVYVERMGFRRSLIDPCVYIHDEKQILMESHGDDTLAVSTEESAMWFRDELQKHFECNVQPLVGVNKRLAKEARFTKRVIRCIPTK